MTATLLQAVSPHVWATAACAARLLPVSLLCPVLGGATVPSTVRLAVVLSCAVFVHVGGGVSLASSTDTWGLGPLIVRELVFGTTIGLVAALPFEAMKIAGRLIDLVRGTSAEAALPIAGSRESATGDLLYQLLLSLAVASGASGAILGAVVRSFGLVAPGTATASGHAWEQVAQLAGAALATGLAIGAPIAAGCLALDLAIALAGRLCPQLHLQELAAPARILGGGALCWLLLGPITSRAVDECFEAVSSILMLAGAGR